MLGRMRSHRHHLSGDEVQEGVTTLVEREEGLRRLEAHPRAEPAVEFEDDRQPQQRRVLGTERVGVPKFGNRRDVGLGHHQVGARDQLLVVVLERRDRCRVAAALAHLPAECGERRLHVLWLRREHVHYLLGDDGAAVLLRLVQLYEPLILVVVDQARAVLVGLTEERLDFEAERHHAAVHHRAPELGTIELTGSVLVKVVEGKAHPPFLLLTQRAEFRFPLLPRRRGRLRQLGRKRRVDGCGVTEGAALFIRQLLELLKVVPRPLALELLLAPAQQQEVLTDLRHGCHPS